MLNPIKNQIGAIFIPVKDIEQARDWYCRILDVPPTNEILFSHLYCIPMQNGLQLVLDSNIYCGEAVRTVPLFHFNTSDISAAFEYMKEKKVNITTGIENGHWFNIKDPFGNVLMVCSC